MTMRGEVTIVGCRLGLSTVKYAAVGIARRGPSYWTSAQSQQPATNALTTTTLQMVDKAEISSDSH